MTRGIIGASLWLTALTVVGTVAPRAQESATVTQLVIVVDGLRPDYVTPEVMPRLFGLGQRGIVFGAHHSVFPTVTRVNASSFVTGVYPEGHGLLGNTIYIPSADKTRGLDTGRRDNLESVARAEGQLLTAPTLAEILRREGKTFLAVSSGSTGSSFLLNPTVPAGGAMLGLRVPPTMTGRVIEEVMRNSAVQPPITVNRVTETVRTSDGSYELTANLSVFAGRRYLDFTEVKRR